MVQPKLYQLFNLCHKLCLQRQGLLQQNKMNINWQLLNHTLTTITRS